MVPFGEGLAVAGQHHGNSSLPQASQKTEVWSPAEILCVQALSRTVPPDLQLGRAN